MGEKNLFTPEQTIILNQVEKDLYLRSNFYFTGGTALSYLYLQHRHSEDLDFFSEKKLNPERILSIVEQWSKTYDFSFKPQLREIVYVFILTFKNGTELKVDFGHYPYKRVEKGMTYKGLDVDSLLDIAINKYTTIHQRSTIKDFVDLYFLLQKFTIWDLMHGAKVKFHMDTDQFTLAGNIFDKIDAFTSLPRMIKPLDLEELKVFFGEQATMLARKSVE